MKVRPVFQGAMRDTLLAILDTLLARDDQETLPGSRGWIVDRVNRILTSSSLMVRFGFQLVVFLFDWGAFFILGFERFTTLPMKVRKRYIRMWMRNKLGIVRNLFAMIRAVVLGVFYDSKRQERLLGYRTTR
jgi:hypothetical protein